MPAPTKVNYLLAVVSGGSIRCLVQRTRILGPRSYTERIIERARVLVNQACLLVRSLEFMVLNWPNQLLLSHIYYIICVAHGVNFLNALPLGTLTLVCGQVSHLIAVGCEPVTDLPLLRRRLVILHAFNLLQSATALLEHHLIVHTLKVCQMLVVLLLH